MIFALLMIAETNYYYNYFFSAMLYFVDELYNLLKK